MSIVDFDTSYWTDDFTQSAPPLAKLLYAYLWTNNHKNVAGIYIITQKTILNETDLTSKQLDANMQFLIDSGKIKYDHLSNLLWVVNHVRRQYLRSTKVSPKIIKAIEKNLLAIPMSHPMISEFLNKYKVLNIGYPYPLEGYQYPSSEGKGEGKGEGKDKGGVGGFKKPTIEEVRAYCEERGNSVDPEKWVDFYTSKGWMIGKSKMKDWRAAVRTWEGNGKEKKPTSVDAAGRPLKYV